MACREPRLWYTNSTLSSTTGTLWLAENRGFGTLDHQLPPLILSYGLPRTAALVHLLRSKRTRRSAMACREPRLWYTHAFSGLFGQIAMACREPRLWYTCFDPAGRGGSRYGLPRTAALVHWQPLRPYWRALLWLAENRGFGTLAYAESLSIRELWLAENRGFGTLNGKAIV